MKNYIKFITCIIFASPSTRPLSIVLEENVNQQENFIPCIFEQVPQANSINKHAKMAIKQPYTFKELVAPNLSQKPLCINFPQIDVHFELKSNLIHLLPFSIALYVMIPIRILNNFMLFAQV